jgi:hypothetical protein
MSKKVTTKQFIEKAVKVHGDKYDYTKTTYTATKDFLIITCPIHGDFSQRANCHTNGKGCKKCGLKERGKKRTMNNDLFIEKANKLFNGKYNYSKINYTNSNSLLEIMCEEHGSFTKKASKHLQGQGCPTCSKINHSGKFKNSTTNEFIKKAVDKHGEKYEYSKVVYKNAIEDVIITCKEHGEFLQTPHTHLTGSGCNKCGIEKTADKKRNTLEYFINKANEKHKNKFKYDKVVYKNTQSKVIISCPLHGDFEQNAGSHLAGNGCPSCSTIMGYYKDKINKIDIDKAREIKCLVYVIELKSDTETFWKIGITSNYIERMKAISKESNYIIKDVYVLIWNKYDCVCLEQYILKKYKRLKYKPEKYFKGHTECFSVNPYNNFKELDTLNYRVYYS